MRAIQYQGNKRFGIVEVPDPRPLPGEVLVRVSASAICGSERHGYSADYESPTNGGHEAMGLIADANDSAKWRVGDRVSIYPMWGCGGCAACGRGEPTMCTNLRFMPPSHAELIAVPEPYLISVPASLDDGAVLGLLGCGIGVAYGGLVRLGLTGVRTILVTGAGPIGLSSILVHKFFGARVFVVEMQPWRVDQARTLGADEVIDPSKCDPVVRARELTGGVGPDACIEASGNGRAFKTCIQSVRVGGTVVTIGNSVTDDLDTWRDLTRRYVSVRGSWHFFLRQSTEVLELVERGLDPGRIVTHRFPYSRVQEAYDHFESGQTGKVILYPD